MSLTHLHNRMRSEGIRRERSYFPTNKATAITYRVIMRASKAMWYNTKHLHSKLDKELIVLLIFSAFDGTQHLLINFVYFPSIISCKYLCRYLHFCITWNEIFRYWNALDNLDALQNLSDIGDTAINISYRTDWTIALYFISLIEMNRSIFVMPSQCNASGMSDWNRTSWMPATACVQLKYSLALSPPSCRFRTL